ncbi:selenocysteine-specific translation elongation factor [Nakamurella sp. DB0629]|uniref:Selenocysteine-specific elongation factor n=1 Tax=Nakamurella aerolata TaxID=1656892 RepID=A0A849ACL6_9ACTN|nr:selenocysteine-specific translation elongation factor [Nakamurella aerolata]NNG36230.1 selenocysteine-specific translation elongation factor [Nakamurella aerolata]
MTPAVVATAGHVDHGKSSLVRALTGIEPDRLAEEHRRGLTIDLGFAWTALPSGRSVAFVDVPGHQRFIGNMLAGLGPAPVVLFVVAADEGWQAQSTDHLDAVRALGIADGLLVISKVDRVDDGGAAALAQARGELAGSPLADVEAVAVSAVTGAGLDELLRELDTVLAGTKAPPPDARVRLWVDRAFSLRGTGTVVTGTLTDGTVRTDDQLWLSGAGGRPQRVTVRSLQSGQQRFAELTGVRRAAVNLRGTSADHVTRGDALVTPGAWPSTGQLDVRRSSGPQLTDLPEQLVVHVGTAAVPARMRPFDDQHARVRLDRSLPLVVSDRVVLRDPGTRRIAGAVVLDADPPALHRRGAGQRRSIALSGMPIGGDVGTEVARRGAVPVAALRRLGIHLPQRPDGVPLPDGVLQRNGWLLHVDAHAGWQRRLRTAVTGLIERDPLSPGLSRAAARRVLAEPSAPSGPPIAALPADFPDVLLDQLATDAGLSSSDGRFRLPGTDALPPEVDAAVAVLRQRLSTTPFAAPDADELAGLGLGSRELAVAERLGRVLRLPDPSGGVVVLLPTAPALAMRELAGLPQPFTAAQARTALHTSRRVTIPLLEHLDQRGWTRRVTDNLREVRAR